MRIEREKKQQTKPTVCFESGPWLEYPPLISSKRGSSFFFFKGAAVAPVLESSSLKVSVTTSHGSL